MIKFRGLLLILATAVYIFFIVAPFNGFESFFLGAGRYSFHGEFRLKDEWRGIILEPNCFSYKYRFPFLYTYGASGYTKISVIPFWADIEKIPNKGYYDTIPNPSLDWPVKSLQELRAVYGSSLQVFSSVNQISKKDREIFSDLQEKGRRSYQHWENFRETEKVEAASPRNRE